MSWRTLDHAAVEVLLRGGLKRHRLVSILALGAAIVLFSIGATVVNFHQRFWDVR